MTLSDGWLGSDQNFLGLREPWCLPEQARVHIWYGCQ